MDKELSRGVGLKPLVVIASDSIQLHGHQAYSVFFGYINSVANFSQAVPLVLPVDPDAIDYASLIQHIDGVVLTGSPSNVFPQHYGETPHNDSTLFDHQRDATILPLIPHLLEAGIPILAVCRGFQEINVVMGGTLNPTVHERPNAIDHREGDKSRPIQAWYEDSHSIEIMPGGILSTCTDAQHVSVNSLHHQGIERLGEGLRIEAKAPDGLIEAFSVEAAKAFALAVQWHPEMRTADNPLAQAIFSAFGEACRQHMHTRLKLSQ